MEENKKGSEYEKYFKEDLEAIEEELSKSKEYSKIIDKEIEMLSAPGLPSKGSQHYLIEHITNAVQLQTQRQGLRKDRVAIKKLIMDYQRKDDLKDVGDEQNILDEVKKLLEKDKKIDSKDLKPKNDVNLDSEIDNILNTTEESE